jgi:hypothetical protein
MKPVIASAMTERASRKVFARLVVSPTLTLKLLTGLTVSRGLGARRARKSALWLSRGRA